jgi:hypothetical protein
VTRQRFAIGNSNIRCDLRGDVARGHRQRQFAPHCECDAYRRIEIGANIRINTMRIAPVDIVLQRSASATFPSESFCAVMPKHRRKLLSNRRALFYHGLVARQIWDQFVSVHRSISRYENCKSSLRGGSDRHLICRFDGGICEPSQNDAVSQCKCS